jgi:hypothetical protein
MALNFPTNPVDGQVYTSGTLSYQWKISSNTWVSVDSISPIAIAAFTKANQQTNVAFSTIIANGTSLVADSNADTLTILTSGNVSITADAAGDNLTFDLTTTGVTAATYGSATIVPVLTVDSRGRLTSVTNTTINTFSFGVVAANGTNLVADTSNDTLTIRTTGNVAITADAAGDNLTFDLTTTGVTAATYGNSTIVPVLTVDSRGRLTSVTNTTIVTSADLSSVVLKTGNTMTGNLVMSGANLSFLASAVAFTNSGIYWSNTPTVGIEAAIYASGANTISLATAKTERVRVIANGTMNLFDNILQRPNIRDYSLYRTDLGNATGSITIDLETGNFFTATTTGTTTWTFSNPPTGTTAGGFILELTNGGSQTQNWPAATKWPSGTAPTLTASGVDVLVFITDDGGTTWRGVASMLDSR